jgi:hypothetical protein
LVNKVGDLTPPSVDPQGWAWTAVKAELAGPVIFAGGPGGEVHRVPTTSWPPGFQIRSFRVSPDGTRAAALIENGSAAGSGFVVLVAAVVRDGGRPVGLGEPITVLGDLKGATGLVFPDPTHVAVLSAKDVANPLLTVAEIGGFAETRALPPNCTRVAMRDVSFDLFAGWDDGTLQRRAPLGWQKATAIRWPSFPG